MVSCFLVNQSHCLLFSDSMYFELHCETGCGVYFITYLLLISRACPMAQMVNNLPAMQETWIWFLGQEDPLEKGMTTHSSLLAWEIPWTEEPGGLKFMGLQNTQDWMTKTPSPPLAPPICLAVFPWLVPRVSAFKQETKWKEKHCPMRGFLICVLPNCHSLY